MYEMWWSGSNTRTTNWAYIMKQGMGAERALIWRTKTMKWKTVTGAIKCVKSRIGTPYLALVQLTHLSIQFRSLRDQSHQHTHCTQDLFYSVDHTCSHWAHYSIHNVLTCTCISIVILVFIYLQGNTAWSIDRLCPWCSSGIHNKIKLPSNNHTLWPCPQSSCWATSHTYWQEHAWHSQQHSVVPST